MYEERRKVKWLWPGEENKSIEHTTGNSHANRLHKTETDGYGKQREQVESGIFRHLPIGQGDEERDEDGVEERGGVAEEQAVAATFQEITHSRVVNSCSQNNHPA